MSQTQSRFRIVKLEERIAPSITKINGGGKTPGGDANGVTAYNPSGKAPAGQNKGPGNS